LTPGENSNIVLSCIIDDTNNGNQNSTGALYYVNLPPWAPGATGFVMNISSKMDIEEVLETLLRALGDPRAAGTKISA